MPAENNSATVEKIIIKYGFGFSIVLYFAFSFAYMIVIPVGESPDEPGHMRCIEQVASDRHLPVMTTNVDEDD